MGEYLSLNVSEVAAACASCSGCVMEQQRPGGLAFIPGSLEAGRLRSRCWSAQFLARAILLAPRLLPAHCPHVPPPPPVCTWGASLVSSPSEEDPGAVTGHTPMTSFVLLPLRGPPLNTIPLGLRLRHRNWGCGGHTNILSLTDPSPGSAVSDCWDARYLWFPDTCLLWTPLSFVRPDSGSGHTHTRVSGAGLLQRICLSSMWFTRKLPKKRD